MVLKKVYGHAHIFGAKKDMDTVHTNTEEDISNQIVFCFIAGSHNPAFLLAIATSGLHQK
jgi:hypothetical protein